MDAKKGAVQILTFIMMTVHIFEGAKKLTNRSGRFTTSSLIHQNSRYIQMVELIEYLVDITKGDSNVSSFRASRPSGHLP